MKLCEGICLETSKLEDVCSRHRGRCDILFSLSTRANSIVPQPRFVSSQNMFFLHNYYNEQGTLQSTFQHFSHFLSIGAATCFEGCDKCLVVEVDLLKLPRFQQEQQQQIESESDDKLTSQMVVKFSSNTKFSSKPAETKATKKKRKTKWNF